LAFCYCRRYRWLQCKDNNKSATVLECFLSGVSKFGLPHRVRSDKGLENTAVADFIISARGPGKISMITGKSVHNQHIERMWRDVFQGGLCIYYNLFHFMENQISWIHLMTVMPYIIHSPKKYIKNLIYGERLGHNTE
jgi:hypothetical protein